MSWNQLLEIIQENRDNLNRQRNQPPTVCPIDGTQLDIHPTNGKRNCPLGNYRWDGGPVVIPANTS